MTLTMSGKKQLHSTIKLKMAPRIQIRQSLHPLSNPAKTMKSITQLKISQSMIIGEHRMFIRQYHLIFRWKLIESSTWLSVKEYFHMKT